MLNERRMPKRRRIPVWIYIILAIFCLAPVVAVVVIKKYIEPKKEAAARAATAPSPFNTIPYQGQTIQLSKAYNSFDEYKNDPNNIAANETARVQKLVTQARVRPSYHVNDGLDQLIAELGFPGYKVRKLETSMPEMGAAFAIEIPRGNQDRIILFQYHLKGARWVLIDDFVGPPGIMDIRSKGGELQFYTLDGQLLARHPQPP